MIEKGTLSTDGSFDYILRKDGSALDLSQISRLESKAAGKLHRFSIAALRRMRLAFELEYFNRSIKHPVGEEALTIQIGGYKTY